MIHAKQNVNQEHLVEAFQSIIPRITSIKPRADKKSEAIFRGTALRKLLRNSSSDVASFFAFKTVLIHQNRPTRPSIDKIEPIQISNSMYTPFWP